MLTLIVTFEENEQTFVTFVGFQNKLLLNLSLNLIFEHFHINKFANQEKENIRLN